MKTKILILIFASLLGFIVFVLNGDGGFKKLTTLSGIYTVKSPSNYPITCFINRTGDDMECFLNKDLNINK